MPYRSLVVADYMTPYVHSVDECVSLAEAEERMLADNLHDIVVTRSGEVVGIVDLRDLGVVSGMEGVDPRKVPVASAMTPHPLTCGPGDSLQEVAEQMQLYRQNLAVVIDSGRPVGIFTIEDALMALRDLAGRSPGSEPPPRH